MATLRQNVGDWISGRSRLTKTKPTDRRRHSRALAGGRLTSNGGSSFGFSQLLSIVSPENSEDYWRVNQLDTSTLDKVSPSKLLELMVDVSPDLSKSFWNYLRLCNPGWSVTVSQLNGESSPAGQAAVDLFLSEMTGVYSESNILPADTIFNLLFTGLFMRGALFTELVLNEQGDKPINIATPDPATARFRKQNHPQLGMVYQLGQLQNGRFIKLNSPTVKYVPIDPLPGKPYGRALAAPALFPSLFLIGMLHDLRRVVMQQGWPRMDIVVELQRIKDSMPEDEELTSAEWATMVDDIITEVETVYSSLEPDDAYVHTDVVDVKRPTGTMNNNSLGVVDSLISRIERLSAKGGKMMPLINGIDEATSDANAKRQWEVMVSSIKSNQHLVETTLEQLLTLALQSQGIAAVVKFRFAELRAAELLTDAMTLQIDIANQSNMYLNGWISQDQAAVAITGDVADQEFPRVISLGGAADVVDDELIDEADRAKSAAANHLNGKVMEVPNE